jgi:plastocyanin
MTRSRSTVCRLAVPVVTAVALAATPSLASGSTTAGTPSARTQHDAHAGHAGHAAAAAAPAAVSVTIGDDFFRPGDVTVAQGGTVTWSNTGDPHTATADDGTFDSGNLNGGDSFRHTFRNAGDYPYVCLYHDDMRGTVHVTPATASRPAVRVVSFGPTPLRLAGARRVRAVYRVGEASRLRATVQDLRPRRTVRTWPVRRMRSAGRTRYAWDGKNDRGRNVRPGRYRMGLKVTNSAGLSRTVWTAFRVRR